MKSVTTDRPANRLAKSTSPYLLQHANNPVDWYEWGEEAFKKAAAEDKPIFLSIGYAACHWCHVMEHESFESDEVAAVLNSGFVAIKVDREERPDIDELYMAYTTALTQHGGWPMSVWLTPDRVPFYAGTYFPKEQFIGVSRQIAETWKSERERITKGADSAKEFFAQWASGPQPAEGVSEREQVDQTAALLSRHFDRTLGGMASGGTNKFPPSMAMDLMLRVFRRTRSSNLLEAVMVTLDHMARGGIYDHVGGGICRYSTDREWLVPHFEKMLYDQALVSSIYLDGYQVTKNPMYAAVAADIFDYVLADLRSAEGGFYSSRDADSEGLEGKFYIWTLPEVKEILGEVDGDLFAKFYDVTETGNWFEHRGHAPAGPKNVLHISKPPAVFAKLHGLDAAEFIERLSVWRKKLAAVRAKRVPPGLDDKILPDWNGLMIAALAKGARVLDRPEYAEAADKAARFILGLRGDDRLYRTYRKGEARLQGNLADYSFMVEGLLNLYEATFNPYWLDAARRLTDSAIKYFHDENGGGFFFTASDAEQLIVRSKHPQDGAIPSANSVMVMNLLRLGAVLDRKDYREKAERTMRAFAPMAGSSPASFERLLAAADFYHAQVAEVAIIGDLAAAETKALMRTVFDHYVPNKVVVHSPVRQEEGDITLLVGKGMINGQPTAYVCERYRCKQPTVLPSELAAQLQAMDSPLKTAIAAPASPPATKQGP